MRHLKSKNKLGLKTAHRLAMLRNLVTQLLEHKQITTTLARAKNIRSMIDKLVNLAKKNDLASKRRIFSFVKSKASVKMLFEKYTSLYSNRQSGYSQIYKVNNRAGDNAKMALIRMVDLDLLKEEPTTATEAKTAETKSVVKEVKKDLEDQGKNKPATSNAVDNSAEKSKEVKKKY